jgi:hypothetical protein
MPAKSLKRISRKKSFKVLTVSAFISFVLIFCWDNTPRKEIDLIIQNDVLEERVTEKEMSVFASINDVFISVKTTLSFHETRLKLQLDTWISTCKIQVSQGRDQKFDV